MAELFPRDWRIALKGGALVIAAVAAWLLLLNVGVTPLAPQIEPSWIATVTHASASGLQFGRDIVYTYGPLGHAVFASYSDRLFIADLVIRSALDAFYVILIFTASRRLPTARRVVFLVAAILVGVISYQAMYLFSLASLALLINRPTRANNWLLPAAAAFAGAAALTKLTFLFYAVLVLAAGIAIATVKGKPMRAVAASAIFAGATIAFWVAAGQHLSNFADFLRTGLEVTRGYSEAMQLPSQPLILGAGLATAAVIAIQGVTLVRSSDDKEGVISVIVAFGAALFFAWKLAFSRADSHTAEFFYFAVVLSAAAPIFFTGTRTKAVAIRDWLCVGVVSSISLACVENQVPGIGTTLASLLRERLLSNATVLLHPRKEQERYRAADLRAGENYALPQIRARVADNRITVFGYEQGIAIANRLNFIPSPTVQSYCDYTSALAGLDSQFYAADRAPPYVIFKLQPIDNRLPTLDDAEVLLKLAYEYDAVLAEKGYLLLEHSARIAPVPSTIPIRETGSIGIGKTLRIPEEPTWCELDFRPTLLGRLVALLYQPPIVVVDIVTTTGETIRRRILPSVTSTGFLLNPLLLSERDFVSFTNGARDDATALVRSINIVDHPRLHRLLDWRVTYRLRTLRRPSGGSELSAQILRDLTGYTDVFSRPAKSVWSSIPPERFVLDGRQFLLVHPLGEVRFQVPAGAKTVSALFAIRPDAYLATAGVEFEATFQPEGGAAIPLFRRMLTPRETTADRGVQHLNAALPGSAGELTLRTLPGPNGRIEWGWAGWSDVHIE
jgi:hypothetical protein